MAAAIGQIGVTPAIRGLYVYPVKSCRGIARDSAVVTERGLWRDREWMIVEASVEPARFVTQRDVPRLALIETALTDDALVLRGHQTGELRIGFETPGRSCQAQVWGDIVASIDQGDTAAEWLSEFVGLDVRLVRFDQREKRPCNPQFVGDSGAHTQFADGYPLLIIGEQSLEDLNRRLTESDRDPLPMNRFRPNIVIDGLESYDEDHVGELTFGDVSVRLVKPCTRCQITTTDQLTAAVGVEPLRTLASYRNNPRLGGVTFGINAIVVRGAGKTLSVGATAEVDWAF
jgi:uncharacterized protein YcbX